MTRTLKTLNPELSLPGHRRIDIAWGRLPQLTGTLVWGMAGQWGGLVHGYMKRIRKMLYFFLEERRRSERPVGGRDGKKDT